MKALVVYRWGYLPDEQHQVKARPTVIFPSLTKWKFSHIYITNSQPMIAIFVVDLQVAMPVPPLVVPFVNKKYNILIHLDTHA